MNRLELIVCRKVNKEYNAYSKYVKKHTKDEMLDGSLKSAFYNAVRGYFVLNDAIPFKYIRELHQDRYTNIIESLWYLYIKYEYANAFTWGGMEELLSIYIKNEERGGDHDRNRCKIRAC